MEAIIENGKLIVSIETMDPPELSTSQKSLVIASTHGNMPTNLKVAGKNVVIGLNAYIKAG